MAGVSHAARTLSEHRALQYLLAHEPELLLPRISFHHLDQILAAVSDFLVPYLAPHVGATEAVRAGEWLARITLSYALCPSDAVDLRDPDSARRFCRTYVLPGLAAPVPQ